MLIRSITMARTEANEGFINDMIKASTMSVYRTPTHVTFGRFGTNKQTLRKKQERELQKS